MLAAQEMGPEQDQEPEAAGPGPRPGPRPHSGPPAAGPGLHCFSLRRTCFWGKGWRCLPSCLPPFLQLGLQQGSWLLSRGHRGQEVLAPPLPGARDPRGHLCSSGGGPEHRSEWGWGGGLREKDVDRWVGREGGAQTGGRGAAHVCVRPGLVVPRRAWWEERTLRFCHQLQRDIGQVSIFPTASVSGSVKWGWRRAPGSP